MDDLAIVSKEDKTCKLDGWHEHNCSLLLERNKKRQIEGKKERRQKAQETCPYIRNTKRVVSSSQQNLMTRFFFASHACPLIPWLHHSYTNLMKRAGNVQ